MITTTEVVWKGRTYTLTVVDERRHQAWWQEPGSPEKRHPSSMPRGLNRAWRNQRAGDAPDRA